MKPFAFITGACARPKGAATGAWLWPANGYDQSPRWNKPRGATCSVIPRTYSMGSARLSSRPRWPDESRLSRPDVRGRTAPNERGPCPAAVHGAMDAVRCAIDGFSPLSFHQRVIRGATPTGLGTRADEGRGTRCSTSPLKARACRPARRGSPLMISPRGPGGDRPTTHPPTSSIAGLAPGDGPAVALNGGEPPSWGLTGLTKSWAIRASRPHGIRVLFSIPTRPASTRR